MKELQLGADRLLIYKKGFTCSSFHSQNFSAVPLPPSEIGLLPSRRCCLIFMNLPHGTTKQVHPSA